MELMLNCFVPSAMEMRSYTIICFNMCGTWMEQLGYAIFGK